MMNFDREIIKLQILAHNIELEFSRVSLLFLESGLTNLFALKNDKTLEETLLDPKYKKFAKKIVVNYPLSLQKKLGNFLLELKNNTDPFYLEFLNKYGDTNYCKFKILDPIHGKKKGLYLYVANEEIMYIGRCNDCFYKRINVGYGNISPKNCYIDGQATNCHLNQLISIWADNISFWVCPLENGDLINYYEKELIKQIQPQWNIALKRNNSGKHS
jgi:hypothetical protein